METAAARNFGVEPDAAGQMRQFVRALVVLALVFALPLFRLFQYSLSSDMYSYMILMPVVSWYLVRLQKPRTIPASRPNRLPGCILLGAALVCGIAALTIEKWGSGMETDAKLDVPILAFLLGVAGVAFIFLGPEQLKACGFPLGILIFLLPVPLAVMDSVVVFLQHGSAWMAEKFFELAGTPVYRIDLEFRLPNNAGIRVAPECSGIHSSYILLITSLLAGHLFLRSPWRRGILAAAVLPLAVLRNGFRVFTIGELCVHYGMEMIDSPIHRKGGPIFFVLSLVPFFLLLVWLRRGDRPARKIEADKIVN